MDFLERIKTDIITKNIYPSKKHINQMKEILCLCSNQKNTNVKRKVYETNRNACYMCKKYIMDDQIMCNVCQSFNDTKRSITCDLNGKVAVVTGGRIKIGFETALMLLRNHTTVIISTRFEQDAIHRYESEPDYNVWRERLYIVECDFLYFHGILKLVNYVKSNFTTIHYLINNAAQTIYRPKEFYHHLTYPDKDIEEKVVTNPFFPYGQLDMYGQQLDLRPTNSWVETIETVNPLEMVSVLSINTVAPAVLIQHLYPLMRTDTAYNYIINVSSMEGKFYRTKTQYHPHTNMAKAALNMLTRTIGKTFRKKYRINVCSVDTGWNTIEEPLHYDVQPPLDCKDGACRIVDPIFSQLNASGVFYKDYKLTDW